MTRTFIATALISTACFGVGFWGYWLFWSA